MNKSTAFTTQEYKTIEKDMFVTKLLYYNQYSKYDAFEDHWALFFNLKA